MLILTWMYDDHGESAENYLIRNLVNADGSGATIIAVGNSPPKAHTLGW